MAIDHEYTDAPVCPHCGYIDEHWMDWLRNYEKGENGEQHCSRCGEKYLWSVAWSVTWKTRKKV